MKDIKEKKIRVFNLAKELNLESKDLLAYCKELGFVVHNQLHGLDPEQAEALKERAKKGPKPGASPRPAPNPGAPPKPIIPPAKLNKPIQTLPKAAPTPAATPVAQLSPIAPKPAPKPPPPPPRRTTHSPEDEAAEEYLRATDGSVPKRTQPTPASNTAEVPSVPQSSPVLPAAPTAPATSVVPSAPRNIIPPLPDGGGMRKLSPLPRAPRPTPPSPVAPVSPLPVPAAPPVAPAATPASAVFPPTAPPRPAPAPIAELPPEPGMPALFHLDVRRNFPFPVALPYHRVFLDADRRAQMESLVHTLQALLKYLTFVGLSDLLQCAAWRGTFGVNGPLVFLQKYVPVTLGQWRVALREVAKRLAQEDENRRVVRELPGAVAEGSPFDNLIGDVLGQRNEWIHDDHMMTFTAEEADELFRYVHPRLLRALWHVRFVAQYPLAFARVSARPVGRRPAVLRFHACIGHRVADGPAETFRAALPVKPDVPFVVAPDHARVLYLWPFIVPQESVKLGRSTLYLFARVAGQSEYLTRIKLAALDTRHETLVHDLGPERAAGFEWLLARLQTDYPPGAVPATEKLGERLNRRTNESLVGRTVGADDMRFALTAWLGAGGNGTVYAATDVAGKPVAVKVLNTADHEEQIDRFEQEFRKLEQLPHPGVVRVIHLDVEPIGDEFYLWFAMEIGQGTLADRAARRCAGLRQGAPWADADCRTAIIDEFRATTAAVAHLHRNRVIHRDVKPANVLVMEDGSLRLTDFGLCKSLAPSEYTRQAGPQSLSGTSLGTPDYMAPEQYWGQRDAVAKSADVYALCMVLAELALGERPSHDLTARAGSTLDGCPAVKTLPAPLAELILTGTAVAPGRRLADADALLEAFERAVAADAAR